MTSYEPSMGESGRTWRGGREALPRSVRYTDAREDEAEVLRVATPCFGASARAQGKCPRCASLGVQWPRPRKGCVF